MPFSFSRPRGREPKIISSSLALYLSRAMMLAVKEDHLECVQTLIRLNQTHHVGCPRNVNWEIKCDFVWHEAGVRLSLTNNQQFKYFSTILWRSNFPLRFEMSFTNVTINIAQSSFYCSTAQASFTWDATTDPKAVEFIFHFDKLPSWSIPNAPFQFNILLSPTQTSQVIECATEKHRLVSLD